MCNWKSKYLPNYQCEEPPLPTDPRGYCILHSELEGKDLKAFGDKVNERITKGKLTSSGWETDNIDLIGCYFPVQFPLNFKEHVFNRPVIFRGTTFSQKANFSEATFSQKVDFVGVKFMNEVDFFKAKFLKEAIFNLTKFSGISNFIGATFSEWAGFSQVTFSQSANFNLATFSGGASFRETIFFGKASFQKATFLKTGVFLKAYFDKEAKFAGARFEKEANFDQTSFKEKTDFTWAEFLDWTFFFKNSNETSVKLENPPLNVVPFNYSYLEGKGKVCYDTLNERLIFAGVMSKEEKGQLLKLSGDASYKNAIEELFKKSQNLTLGNPTTFHNARFLGKEVIFQDVDLSLCSFLHSNIDKVDFRYCEFAEVNSRKNILRDELEADKAVGAGFKPAPTVDELDGDEDVEKNLSETSTRFFPFTSFRVRMTEDEEKLREDRYEPVRRLYLELKRNFEDKKNWNTAGDFHYGEMECRRKMKGWLGRNILSLEALYYLTSGYGERPWKAFSWVAILTLSFALFYTVPIVKSSPPGVTKTIQTQTDSSQPLHSSAPAREDMGEGIDPQPATQAPPIQGQEAQPANEPKGQSWSEWPCGFLDHHPCIKNYPKGLNTSLRVTFHLDRDQKEGWLATIQSIFGPAFVALFFLALRRKVKR